MGIASMRTPGSFNAAAVVVRVGAGDGGERVEQRVAVGDLAAQPVAVAVQRQVLLPDAHRSAAGLPTEVHVESGAGADDDVRLDALEVGGDPGVGEPASYCLCLLSPRGNTVAGRACSALSPS